MKTPTIPTLLGPDGMTSLREYAGYLQPDRPRRRLSQRLPAQEQHQQRPLKHQKVLPPQSLQKARQPPVPVQRKRRK